MTSLSRNRTSREWRSDHWSVGQAFPGTALAWNGRTDHWPVTQYIPGPALAGNGGTDHWPERQTFAGPAVPENGGTDHLPATSHCRAYASKERGTDQWSKRQAIAGTAGPRNGGTDHWSVRQAIAGPTVPQNGGTDHLPVTSHCRAYASKERRTDHWPERQTFAGPAVPENGGTDHLPVRQAIVVPMLLKNGELTNGRKDKLLPELQDHGTEGLTIGRYPHDIMLGKLLLTAAVALAAIHGSAAQVTCADGWTAHEQHCYKKFSIGKKWAAAREYCGTFDADLVSITSTSEQQFVAPMITGSGVGGAWIGLHDTATENVFAWVDDTPYDPALSMWGYGAPDNEAPGEDCVYMYMSFRSYTAKWNDLPCWYRKAFVCEREIQHPFVFFSLRHLSFSVCAIDIVLALDLSSSIPQDQFELARDFMVAFVDCEVFQEKDIRIAVLNYTCEADTYFDLAPIAYGMSYEIGQLMRGDGGITRTGHAINHMRLTSKFGADAHHTAVILTDGQTMICYTVLLSGLPFPQSEDDQQAAAADARNAGIELYAVEFGYLVNGMALATMTGDPSGSRVFDTSQACDAAQKIVADQCGPKQQQEHYISILDYLIG
uniref:C-type lectin domain-containing protein n=1 Tax=Branchiostoma floridae TaxID=7739 RepID=C3ZU84_BRAFL|eukprot:XP_002587959.1 hypothetical protein BRAFLDRAFT_87354 [Branchiostoma floridae]